MKITKTSGHPTSFEGDGIVVPCDVDLTYRKTNDILRDVYAQAGSRLWEELADIGYCEIGHTVITQGYNLRARHLIFLPYTDREDTSHRMNYILLHQAVRGALSLASLYDLRTLAIPIVPNLLSKRRTLLKKAASKLFDAEDEEQTNEAENIIESIAKDFESESLKEVSLFL